MKRIFTIIILFVLVSITTNAQIISQYIETTTGTVPKGIEIWNNTASTIDFSTTNLVVQQGTNGGALTDVVTVNTGTLLSGAVMVIGTAADANSGTGFKDFVEANGATFITKAFNFNGNDALAIKLNGVTTDVFGNPGSDPGSSWSGSTVSTANQNISILDGINTGDLDGWTDPSTRFSTTTTDNSLTGFGIAPTTTPLPVSLTSFTASIFNSNVELNWTTATEVNNYGFEVQRSVASSNSATKTWEKIGFVEGHGNSNSPKDYSFIDASAPKTEMNYRLKQIDVDGSYSYSDIVSVNLASELPKKMIQYPNYPNPFNPSTTIKFAIPSTSNVTLKIYDVIGNEVASLINEKKEAGEYEIVFNAKQLPSGIYFSRLQSNGSIQTQKLLLIK